MYIYIWFNAKFLDLKYIAGLNPLHQTLLSNTLNTPVWDDNRYYLRQLIRRTGNID